jgi:hypothetical protein
MSMIVESCWTFSAPLRCATGLRRKELRKKRERGHPWCCELKKKLERVGRPRVGISKLSGRIRNG